MLTQAVTAEVAAPILTTTAYAPVKSVLRETATSVVDWPLWIGLSLKAVVPPEAHDPLRISAACDGLPARGAMLSTTIVSLARGALEKVTLPAWVPLRKINVTGGGAGSATALRAPVATADKVGVGVGAWDWLEPPEQATVNPITESSTAMHRGICQGV
jgi:hypothetical protein